MSLKEDKILAIDVGNTNIHWCYIQSGEPVGEYKRIKHVEISLLPWDEIKKQNCPVVIAGALTHINETLERITDEYKIQFVEINTSKQNVIKNTYHTLGIDRVCNLIASLNLIKNINKPLVVFDFGTATTVTVCDKDKNFLGGLIKTGFETELKGIASNALSLPHINLAKEQKVSKLNPLSNNTEDSILQGVIIGQIALIEYYLKSLKEEIKVEPIVIFTGGNAPIVLRFIERKPDLHEPMLTIKGIYYCYKSCLQKA